jgi:hypothetical protein
MTKKVETPEVANQPVEAPQDASLATVSMVLGVISLAGPGLLFGIPAIITSSIALKKKLPGRGLSITGLVTGIVSTVLSLLFIGLMILLFIWGMNHPEILEEQSAPAPTEKGTQQLFESSRT